MACAWLLIEKMDGVRRAVGAFSDKAKATAIEDAIGTAGATEMFQIVEMELDAITPGNFQDAFHIRSNPDTGLVVRLDPARRFIRVLRERSVGCEQGDPRHCPL